MALYFVTFKDRVSLVLDAHTEVEAHVRAREIAEGDAPARVVELAPGAFVAEVELDEDEDGVPFVALDPLEHTEAILAVLETGEPSGDVTPTLAAVCGASADYGDPPEVVFCAQRSGHENDHEGVAASGEPVTWPR